MPTGGPCSTSRSTGPPVPASSFYDKRRNRSTPSVLWREHRHEQLTTAFPGPLSPGTEQTSGARGHGMRPLLDVVQKPACDVELETTALVATEALRNFRSLRNTPSSIWHVLGEGGALGALACACRLAERGRPLPTRIVVHLSPELGSHQAVYACLRMLTDAAPSQDAWFLSESRLAANSPHASSLEALGATRSALERFQRIHSRRSGEASAYLPLLRFALSKILRSASRSAGENALRRLSSGLPDHVVRVILHVHRTIVLRDKAIDGQALRSAY